MMEINVSMVVTILGLLGAGISVWVTLRERLVRAETKIDTLEAAHKEHKSEVQSLREWLEGQFSDLRKSLERKVDK